MDNKRILKRFSLLLWMSVVAYLIPLGFCIFLLALTANESASSITMSFAMFIVSFAFVILPLLILRLILIFLKKENQIRIKYIVLSFLHFLVIPFFFIFQTFFMSSMDGANYGELFSDSNSTYHIIALSLVCLAGAFNLFVIIYGFILTKPMTLEKSLKRKERRMELAKQKQAIALEKKLKQQEEKELLKQKQILKAEEKQKLLEKKKIEAKEKQELKESNKIEKQVVLASKKENIVVAKQITTINKDSILNPRSNIFKYLSTCFAFISITLFFIGLFQILTLGADIEFYRVNSLVAMVLTMIVLFSIFAYYVFIGVRQFIKKDCWSKSQKLSDKILLITLLPIIVLLVLLFVESLPFRIDLFPIVSQVYRIDSSSIVYIALSIYLFILFIVYLVLNAKTYRRLYKEFDEATKNNIDEEWVNAHKKPFERFMTTYLKVNNCFRARKNSKKVINVYDKVTNLGLFTTILSFIPCLVVPIVLYYTYLHSSTFTFKLVYIMPILLIVFVFEVIIYARRKTNYKVLVGNVYVNENNDDLKEEYAYFANYYLDNCLSEKVLKRNQKRYKIYSKGTILACFDDAWTAIFIGLPILIAFIYIALFIIVISIIIATLSSGSSTYSSSTYTATSSDEGTDSNTDTSHTSTSNRLRLEGNGYNEWYDIESNGDIRINGSYTDFRLFGNDICRLEGEGVNKQWKTIATLSSGSDQGMVLYLNNYDGPRPFMKWHK